MRTLEDLDISAGTEPEVLSLIRYLLPIMDGALNHPRIDLIAECLPTEHQPRGSHTRILGVPTPHATLDNMAGAPPVPAGHRARAYVLLPPRT